MERHTYESFSKSWFSAETLILPSLPLQVSLSTDRQPSSWDVEVFTSSYKKLSVKLFFHGEDDATLTKLQVMATTIERLIHLLMRAGGEMQHCTRADFALATFRLETRLGVSGSQKRANPALYRSQMRSPNMTVSPPADQNLLTAHNGPSVTTPHSESQQLAVSNAPPVTHTNNGRCNASPRLEIPPLVLLLSPPNAA